MFQKLGTTRYLTYSIVKDHKVPWNYNTEGLPHSLEGRILPCAKWHLVFGIYADTLSHCDYFFLHTCLKQSANYFFAFPGRANLPPLLLFSCCTKQPTLDSHNDPIYPCFLHMCNWQCLRHGSRVSLLGSWCKHRSKDH